LAANSFVDSKSASKLPASANPPTSINDKPAGRRTKSNSESEAGRIEQLEAEQDRIEYDLGQPDAPSGSRKWSGMP
jgi:hypothetical protein